MEYPVEIIEIRRCIVSVEAESKIDAHIQASNMYNKGRLDKDLKENTELKIGVGNPGDTILCINKL